ncbi:MAG: MotA/TolQ/ExbB proton channel family protein [Eggerthellaceae bacterium]|nr:MotA/TolQ/ExbB proton channel family protein [Eggerthellaceae bacterium]
MEISVAQSYLGDILHIISQAMLVPVIAALILLIAYALFSVGSLFSEYMSERRKFKAVMPKFLADLTAAEQADIPDVINNSGLISRQKTALLTVYDYRMLPSDTLVGLTRRLVTEEAARYEKIRSRNSMAARISPMVGLMGTLIPLGPGIDALGRADTAALSASLLIAFDTTVAGLIVAAVCLLVARTRGRWYDDYMSALDTAMGSMVEKIEKMRESGEILTETPSNYAFVFELTRGQRVRAGGIDSASGSAAGASGGGAGSAGALDSQVLPRV